MNAPLGTPLKTLRIEDCTLHAVPSEDGIELHVITRDGVQAVIVPKALEIATFVSETQDVLTGAPVHIHKAGMRLSQRHLTRLPSTPQTQPAQAQQSK